MGFFDTIESLTKAEQYHKMGILKKQLSGKPTGPDCGRHLQGGVFFWFDHSKIYMNNLKYYTLRQLNVTIPLYLRNYQSQRILPEEYYSHLLKIFLKLEIFVRMIHDYWILSVEITFYISLLCMINTISPLMPPKLMFIILF